MTSCFARAEAVNVPTPITRVLVSADRPRSGFFDIRNCFFPWHSTHSSLARSSSPPSRFLVRFPYYST